MNKRRYWSAGLLALLTVHFVYAGNGDAPKPTVLSGTIENPRVLVTDGGEFSMHLPQLAGVFRLGIAHGKESYWLSDKECEKKLEKEGRLTLTYQGIFSKTDRLTLRINKLTDSDGFVLEAEATGLPADAQLYWAFGACYGRELANKYAATMKPEYCKDNVFSVEGTAFSVYYGESMRLRIVQGITPPQSDIRLSDTHRQDNPLTIFRSGKKTDAPAISAACRVINGEKYYFCCYTQNKKADYNYFKLPDLFAKEYKEK